MIVACLAFVHVQAFAEEGKEPDWRDQSWDNPSAVTSVKKFAHKISFRLLAVNNYISFWSSEYHEGAIHSNRPIDIGAGIGFGDFALDFKYAIPFTVSPRRTKSETLDTDLDFFPYNIWLKFKYRMYSGFTVGSYIDYEDEDPQPFVDLQQRDMYVQTLWMATAGPFFSVRAAYFLDRIQGISAGSVVAGGRIQRSTYEDRDNTLAFYADRRDMLSGWVNMGYTYTWVFKNAFFLNLWGVAGVAAEISNVINEEFDLLAVLPEADFKLAVGRWHERWSWNFVGQVAYQPSIFGDHWEQRLIVSAQLLVVHRFF